jgi:hypothetical protein
MNALGYQISPEIRADGVGFRRHPQSTALSGDAIRLMLQLEKSVPVNALADRFPHVVNKLAQLWRRPFHADRYFDDLLHDKRGGRIGFPLAVVIEISELHNHYRANVFPVREDSWSSALYR